MENMNKRVENILFVLKLRLFVKFPLNNSVNFRIHVEYEPIFYEFKCIRQKQNV